MITKTLVTALLLAIPLWAYTPTTPGDIETIETKIEEIKPLASTTAVVLSRPLSLLFVGDLMLGRRVETMANTRSFNFPFASTTALLKSVDIAVGNLEGAVPQPHIHTPDLTFRFSFPEAALVATKQAGFDVLSLANNHTYDYGERGYQQTLAACKRHELLCAGSPNRVSTSSIQHVSVADTEIALLMINATYGYPTWSDLEGHLSELQNTTDLQFAYIHWGEEYTLRHNGAQKELAETLIAGGVDAVFGHHPHVVQDIALYRGAPIFYSLGNFVFDQYFSDEVQIGLAVKVHITEADITYEFIPLTARESRSQPQIANDELRKILWDRSISNIKDHPYVSSVHHSITVPRSPGR